VPLAQGSSDEPCVAAADYGVVLMMFAEILTVALAFAIP